MTTTGRAIARSVGLGVDMKEQPCFKKIETTVRAKTRMPPRRSMSCVGSEGHSVFNLA